MAVVQEVGHWWPVNLKLLEAKYEKSKLKVRQNSLYCKLSIIQLQNAVEQEKFITQKYEKEVVHKRLVHAEEELAKQARDKEDLSKKVNEMLQKSGEEWKEKMKKTESLNALASSPSSSLTVKNDYLETEESNIGSLPEKTCASGTMADEVKNADGVTTVARGKNSTRPNSSDCFIEFANHDGETEEMCVIEENANIKEGLKEDVETSFLQNTEKTFGSYRLRSASNRETSSHVDCDDVFNKKVTPKSNDEGSDHGYRTRNKTRRATTNDPNLRSILRKPKTKRRVTFSNELDIRHFNKTQKETGLYHKRKSEGFVGSAEISNHVISHKSPVIDILSIVTNSDPTLQEVDSEVKGKATSSMKDLSGATADILIDEKKASGARKGARVAKVTDVDEDKCLEHGLNNKPLKPQVDREKKSSRKRQWEDKYSDGNYANKQVESLEVSLQYIDDGENIEMGTKNKRNKHGRFQRQQESEDNPTKRGNNSRGITRSRKKKVAKSDVKSVQRTRTNLRKGKTRPNNEDEEITGMENENVEKRPVTQVRKTRKKKAENVEETKQKTKSKAPPQNEDEKENTKVTRIMKSSIGDLSTIDEDFCNADTQMADMKVGLQVEEKTSSTALLSKNNNHGDTSIEGHRQIKKESVKKPLKIRRVRAVQKNQPRDDKDSNLERPVEETKESETSKDKPKMVVPVGEIEYGTSIGSKERLKGQGKEVAQSMQSRRSITTQVEIIVDQRNDALMKEADVVVTGSEAMQEHPTSLEREVTFNDQSKYSEAVVVKPVGGRRERAAKRKANAMLGATDEIENTQNEENPKGRCKRKVQKNCPKKNKSSLIEPIVKTGEEDSPTFSGNAENEKDSKILKNENKNVLANSVSLGEKIPPGKPLVKEKKELTPGYVGETATSNTTDDKKSESSKKKHKKEVPHDQSEEKNAHPNEQIVEAKKKRATRRKRKEVSTTIIIEKNANGKQEERLMKQNKGKVNEVAEIEPRKASTSDSKIENTNQVEPDKMMNKKELVAGKEELSLASSGKSGDNDEEGKENVPRTVNERDDNAGKGTGGNNAEKEYEKTSHGVKKSDAECDSTLMKNTKSVDCASSKNGSRESTVLDKKPDGNTTQNVKKRKTLYNNRQSSILMNKTSGLFQETLPLNTTRSSTGMPHSLSTFMKAFIVPKLKK